MTIDQSGRKTRVRVTRPEDYRPNVSAGGSPFSLADRRPNLPGGGIATTYYDELDRPIEAEVRDAQGGFVMKAVCRYDEKGRVLEERLTMNDPGAFAPMHEDIGVTNAVKGWLRAQADDRWVKFFYDSENLVRALRQQEPGKDETIVTTYNEYGDPVVEITTTRSAEGEETSYSEMRHTYQYDHVGNWTEKVSEYRLSPHDALQATRFTIRRALEYF